MFHLNIGKDPSYENRIWFARILICSICYIDCWGRIEWVTECLSVLILAKKILEHLPKLDPFFEDKHVIQRTKGLSAPHIPLSSLRTCILLREREKTTTIESIKMEDVPGWSSWCSKDLMASSLIRILLSDPVQQMSEQNPFLFFQLPSSISFFYTLN